MDPRRFSPASSCSGSGEQGNSNSGSTWKPGEVQLDIPIRVYPELGYGIHFPESSDGLPPSFQLLRNSSGGIGIPMEEFSKHFDSPAEYERKLEKAMERTKRRDLRAMIRGEWPKKCEVCLKSKDLEHFPRECPYLVRIAEAWNVAVGEGYKIVCFCCAKSKSQHDHPDGTWSGYASKILPKYTVDYTVDYASMQP